MSELAFNLNGDPFEVPANATGWRVRRMKPKGAPETVYGRSGQPLVVPLEADIDDVRVEVGGTPGRYRFDPVDDNNKPIPDAPAGYAYVHEVGGLVTVVDKSSQLPAASDSVVIEAMRMNAEIAKAVVDRLAVVDRFPQMLEASAALLRAADGAGLPARPGMVVHAPLEDDGDDEDEDDNEDDDNDRDDGDKRSGGFDIGAFLMQIAPVLVSLTNGKLRLADLLSWTKAAEKGAAARKEASTPAPAKTAAPTEPSAEQQLQSDPAVGLHFMSIMNALTPTEAELARTMAQELSSQDRTAWFNNLKTLSVADAVAKVRAELERLNKKGGAS